MATKFWSASDIEPKRSFRWYCSFGRGTNKIETYHLRSFLKPSFEIAVAEYIMINDVHYRPGLLSWNPIEITITDVEGAEDNSKKLYNILKEAGWSHRADANNPRSAIQKKQMERALGGDMTFTQIDAAGSVAEKWKIINPFITNVNFGQGNYSIDEIMTISMTIRYDTAQHSTRA